MTGSPGTLVRAPWFGAAQHPKDYFQEDGLNIRNRMILFFPTSGCASQIKKNLLKRILNTANVKLKLWSGLPGCR